MPITTWDDFITIPINSKKLRSIIFKLSTSTPPTQLPSTILEGSFRTRSSTSKQKDITFMLSPLTKQMPSPSLTLGCSVKRLIEGSRPRGTIALPSNQPQDTRLDTSTSGCFAKTLAGQKRPKLTTGRLSSQMRITLRPISIWEYFVKNPREQKRLNYTILRQSKLILKILILIIASPSSFIITTGFRRQKSITVNRLTSIQPLLKPTTISECSISGQAKGRMPSIVSQAQLKATHLNSFLTEDCSKCCQIKRA